MVQIYLFGELWSLHFNKRSVDGFHVALVGTERHPARPWEKYMIGAVNLALPPGMVNLAW